MLTWPCTYPCWDLRPHHSQSHFAPLHSGNTICCWRSLWKGNRWFAWRTDYAQRSYIKSHLRSTLVPQPVSSGNGKGCPMWSWPCLKMLCAWSMHSSRGENRKGLPYRCAIYFHFVKRAMSNALALLPHIPASSAPETEIAFIESRNYLISLARLCVMCFASQWLHGAKSPANRAAACPRSGPENRRGQRVPWADWDPWLFRGCFCFSGQKQCLKTPGDFPSPICQAARLLLTSCVSDGALRGGHAQGSPRAASAGLREMGELVPVWSGKQGECSKTVSLAHSGPSRTSFLESNTKRLNDLTSKSCIQQIAEISISIRVTNCPGLPRVKSFWGYVTSSAKTIKPLGKLGCLSPLFQLKCDWLQRSCFWT